MTKTLLIGAASALILAACSAATTGADKAGEMAEKIASDTISKVSDTSKLDEILAAQSEKAQARYDARNPKATLEFFGIKPGMTVVEALPGGGWYSKILIPYPEQLMLFFSFGLCTIFHASKVKVTI